MTNSAIAMALLPALVVRRMPDSVSPADCSCADPAPKSGAQITRILIRW